MLFGRAFGTGGPPSPTRPGGGAARPAVAETVARIETGGHHLPVVTRRNPRARRLSLRIDGSRDAVVLTVPAGVSARAAEAFLAQHADWAAERLAALPPRTPFVDGAVVPLFGRDRRIRHAPEARGRVFLDGPADETIVVTGRPEHLARRLTDHLKAEARAAIKPAVRTLAARIDRTPGRITIRDQRTRWGSCTAAGALNFSWRLVLCPPEILTYVVAHEVAHLRHMDHSPAFWRTLATLVPEPERSRAWLRAHGERLHRIG